MKTLSSPVLLLVIILAGFSLASFVLATGKIDINSAPLEDLMKIVHIGEVRAKELISLRPFSSIDELTIIKGIGISRVEDIKKQGLAWVGAISAKPSLTETKPSLVEKELATVGEQITQKSSFPLLIPVVVAVFSGIIILTFKRKLK